MSKLTAIRKHAPVMILSAGVLAGAVLGPLPEARGTGRRGHAERRDAGAPIAERTAPPGKAEGGPALGELADFASVKSLEDALDAAGVDRDLRVVWWLSRASAEEIAEAAAWYYNKTGAARKMADDAVGALITARWLEVDREAALRAVSGRYRAVSLAKLDPAAALEAAKGDADQFGGVVEAIGEEDPEAAVALLRNLPPKADANMAWRGIMTGLARKDPEQAARLAEATGEDPGPGVRAWARRDPEAAAAWAEEIRSPGTRESVMDAVMAARAAADPEDALRECLTLPPGEARSRWIAQALEGLGMTDPEKALAGLSALEGSAERRRAGAALVAAWSGSDPDRALALLKDLGTGDGFDAERSWEWRTLEEPGTPGDGGMGHRDARLETAVRELMRWRPRETAEFLTGLPASANAPVEEAFRHWAEEDAAETSAWLAEAPADAPGRDAAIGSLVRALWQGEREDEEAALRWSLEAGGEQGPGLVKKSLEWLGWDGESPEPPPLEGLPLTPADLERIRQIIP